MNKKCELCDAPATHVIYASEPFYCCIKHFYRRLKERERRHYDER